MTASTRIIDHDYVVGRIADWEKRLNELYSNLENWTKNIGEVEIRRTEVPQAREELMQKFDVEPRNLPAIAIKLNKNRLSFMPMGLWVIGANGRLNIKTSKNHYILVDIGGEEGAPSEWVIVSPVKRSQRVPMKEVTITKLLKDEDPFV